MIPDWDTNTVWISDQLPHRHPLLVPKLQAILRKHGIPLRTVAQTNDVWIRDYAPIQVSRTEFVKFRYEPDYLTAKFAHLITAKEVFDDIPFLKHRQDSRIILDGGNVVASRNRVILTEKVFTENPRRNRTSLMRKLGQILRAEITIIPREKFDRIGHADGMVRFLADDVVVVNDYSDIAPRLQAQLTKVLSKLGLQVETLSYFPENRTRKGISSAVGNYVNFLRVGNLIVLPAYGIPSDGQAKKQMKRICPDAKVISLFCKDLAREGGVLNCVTWTIRAGRQESSGGDPQRLVFLAENGQRIPLKSIKVKGPHVGIWWHSTSRLVAVLQPNLPRDRFRKITPGTPFQIGDITVTGYLVDHSIYAALAFLIEADGKRLLYSGDLRLHGRKPGMVETLLKALTDKPVDVLLMEGTHISHPDHRGPTEYELEDQIFGHVKSALGLVLASFSPQHVDRLVAFLRTAKKSGRVFVADVYTAFIMHLIASEVGLPPPEATDWIKVFYPKFFEESFRKKGLEEIYILLSRSRIGMEEIRTNPSRYVMLFRPSMLESDFGGDLPEHSRCLYSRWTGYLDRPDWQPVKDALKRAHGDLIEVHTSGHIFADDIVELIQRISPKSVLPIHTFEPERFSAVTPNVILLTDGESYQLV